MSVLVDIFRFLFAGNGWRLTFLACLIYGVALYSLVLPVLFALAIDILLPQALAAHLVAVVCAALLLALLRFCLTFVQDYEFQRLRQRCETSALRRVLAGILARPEDPAHDAQVASLDGWLRLWLVNFQYQMTEILFFAAYAVLISATVLVVIFWVDAGTGLIVLLFAVLHYANFRYHSSRSTAQARDYGNNKTSFVRHVSVAIGAKRAINIAGMNDRIGAALHQRADCAFRSGSDQVRTSASQAMVQSVLRGTLYLLIVGYSTPRIADGQMTLGSLLLILMLVSFAYEPVYRLNQITLMANQLLANCAPLRPFLVREPVEPAAVPGKRPDDPVEISGVGHVVAGRELFRSVSARLKRDQLYLLKGPSGAGKSTLLDLISGLTRPSKGTIRWAGSPMMDHREAIYLSRQNSTFFLGRLADNISLFDPEPDRALICQLLTDVGLEAMAQDIDADIVPERLSLGERQRIALARSLYRDATLLLLDEPTAHLDSLTEQKCLSAVLAHRAGRITVMVSHGHSATVIADRIIMIGATDGD